MNSTFLTLLSKKDGDKGIKDFWPISLLSGVYKIIGKTFSLRLNEVFGELVSDYQCCGVDGKQIHEGVLVVNELVDSRLKSKKPGSILKLDFKNAFDMVSREFLKAQLEKFGFGLKRCKWQHTCWTSARFKNSY